MSAAGATGWIELTGVRTHNLRGVDVRVPHNTVTAFTGVSGSGKSSLVIDTLHAEAQLRYVEGLDPYVRGFLTPRDRPRVDRVRGLTATLAVGGKSSLLNQVLAGSVAAGLDGRPFTTVGGLSGLAALRWVTVVDQAPIGRTPRSNPATYTKAFDLIHHLFAGTRAAGSGGPGNPSSFSFNSPGGRCETCQGLGRVKLDMRFLGDTYLTCRACDGRRYTPEVLAVTYHGLAIDEVLGLTVSEAAGVFDMGPGAGDAGGRIVDAGTPAHVASGSGPTAAFLRRILPEDA